MMKDKYIGRKIVMTTDCIKNDTGWWTVVINVIQSRSEDLEEWEDVEASIKTIDKSLDNAIGNAYTSMFMYGDLFGEQNKDENKELLN
jgi:hypothetical protein